MTSPVTPGSDPLQQWRGSFGGDYMQRNRVTGETTGEAAAVFSRILERSRIRDDVGSILEVGANVGINLTGLREVLGGEAKLAALEPNPRACETLRERGDLDLAEIITATAYEIPLPDASYDLVFTNGVLIHVPPERLPEAMREICRVSSKYVLCSEYFSHNPEAIQYHGRPDMLWKEDFGKRYLEVCPELRIREYGFTWQVEFPHFDDLNWWVFEKTAEGAA